MGGIKAAAWVIFLAIGLPILLAHLSVWWNDRR